MGLSHPRFVSWAAQDGRVDDLVYHLRRAGLAALNPSPASPKQRAPIHLAAVGGHVQCIKVLRDAGSSLDVRDKEGHTPLHIAVFHQHYSTVCALLEMGAIVDPGTRFGVTPLHLAASVGHTPCVRLLAGYGASLNAQESWGQTALSIATLRGRLDTMKALLSFGADPEIKDYQHMQTPLHIACASKDEERVLVLLDAGCDVHSMDGGGRSPLGVALINKFYRVIPLLMEYGAVLNDTDRSSLPTALLDYLDKQNDSPLQLSRLCRVSVRRFLGPTHFSSGGLEGMELPSHIHSFLCSVLEVCQGEELQREAVAAVPIVRPMILEG